MLRFLAADDGCGFPGHFDQKQGFPIPAWELELLAAYSSRVGIRELEEAAVRTGITHIRPGSGTVEFYHNTGRIIGYDKGKPTTWVCAEVTPSYTYPLHGRPMNPSGFPTLARMTLSVEHLRNKYFITI
jgi:hypothetical protein